MLYLILFISLLAHTNIFTMDQPTMDVESDTENYVKGKVLTCLKERFLNYNDSDKQRDNATRHLRSFLCNDCVTKTDKSNEQSIFVETMCENCAKIFQDVFFLMYVVDANNTKALEAAPFLPKAVQNPYMLWFLAKKLTAYDDQSAQNKNAQALLDSFKKIIKNFNEDDQKLFFNKLAENVLSQIEYSETNSYFEQIKSSYPQYMFWFKDANTKRKIVLLHNTNFVMPNEQEMKQITSSIPSSKSESIINELKDRTLPYYRIHEILDKYLLPYTTPQKTSQFLEKLLKNSPEQFKLYEQVNKQSPN